MKAIHKAVLQVVLGVSVLFPLQDSARATDVTFLCAGALESWAKDLIPEFEQTSGHNVKATFALLNVITAVVRKNDAADLVIVSPQQWEALHKEGKLDPAVRVVIAKTGFGVFVKKGAAKPDITSLEMFKRAFLNARSIALFDPAVGGPTGIFTARLFERLGMTAELKSKIKHPTRSADPLKLGPRGLFELVAQGHADIGVAQISEIVAEPSVDLVGPLPVEIQDFTIFTAAIPTNTKHSAAARALIDFLVSPKATSTLKSKGLEQD